ncbi:MAG: hypothetical protein JWM04_1997 [Verrucomicrobiales bacterium]|nr:hypothetical protein [Verrucomicrobiales bacterium]
MSVTIRRHQNWIWYILIFVIIIAFVVFFNPASKMSSGRGGSDRDWGTLRGRPITGKEYSDAKKEAEIFYFLKFHQWPTARDQFGFDADRETYNRLFMMDKFRELKIQISPEATTDYITTVFRGPNQPFNLQVYENFIKETLVPHELTRADFERFAERQVGQQHLITLVGLPGRLVTPQEGEALFRHENDATASEIVFFNSSNFVKSVVSTEPLLRQYYSNNAAAYRLQEQMVVSYAKIASSNFVDEAEKLMLSNTNLDKILDAEYLRNGGTNFYVDNTPAKKPLPIAEAKAKIRAEGKDKYATSLADRKANDLLTELFKAADKTPLKVGDFENFAKQKGLEVKMTKPFEERSAPTDINVPNEFGQIAFQMSGTEPVSTRPVVAEDGVYLIAFRERFPSRIRTFEEVKTTVTADFLRDESKKLASVAAQKFLVATTNAMAQGKSFSAAALAEKHKVMELPPIAISTRTLPELEGKVNLSMVRDAISTMPIGKTAAYVPGVEGGAVVSARAHLPVDEAKVKAELPQFIEKLRDQRQNEAFSEWFQHSIQNSLKLPVEKSTPRG